MEVNLRSEFAKGRVGDDEAALILSDVLQGGIRSLVLLVVQNGVTLGEGTTFNVLTGNTDMVALFHQRTKGEGLRGGPVDVLTLINGLLAVGQNTLEVAVDGEALWGAANLVGNVAQQRSINSGRQMRQNLGGQLLRSLEAVPSRGQPFLAGGLVILAAVEAVVEHTPNPLFVLVNVLFGEGALSNQLLDILVKLSLLLGDALVHQGLSERGLVGFVVTLLTVADDVNDDVALELGTPVGSNLTNVVHGLDIISVHVEHRGVDGLGDIRAVRGGTRVTGVGSETNLVVHDDVDSTTGRVGGERVEAHGLVDDTLGGEGSITVQQNTHGAVEVLLIIVVVQNRARLAKNNGVLGFQMGGVGDQRELHTLTRGRGTFEVHTQVVLDITRTFIRRLGGSREFTEDGLVGLTNNVGQYIETTTVRHTNDNVLDAVLDAAVNQRLHTRHKGLATLQTETLVIGELGGQEGLEAVTPDQTVKDTALVVNRVLVGLRNFEAITDPVAGLTIRNVNVLHTIGATINPLAGGDDLAQSHLLAALSGEARQNTRAEGELLVKIALSKPIVVKFKLLGLVVAECLSFAADAKGIDLGLVMTTSLVCANQKLNLEMICQVSASRQAQSLTRHGLRNATGGRRHKSRRRLKSLGDGHAAFFHVLKICLPRDVHAGGVLLPSQVHLVNVVGCVSGKEVVIGILNSRVQVNHVFSGS